MTSEPFVGLPWAALGALRGAGAPMTTREVATAVGWHAVVSPTNCRRLGPHRHGRTDSEWYCELACLGFQSAYIGLLRAETVYPALATLTRAGLVDKVTNPVGQAVLWSVERAALEIGAKR